MEQTDLATILLGCVLILSYATPRLILNAAGTFSGTTI